MIGRTISNWYAFSTLSGRGWALQDGRFDVGTRRGLVDAGDCFAFSLAAIAAVVLTVTSSALGFAAEDRQSIVNYDEVTLSPDATKIGCIESESAVDRSNSSHNVVTVRDIHGRKIGSYDPCPKCEYSSPTWSPDSRLKPLGMRSRPHGKKATIRRAAQKKIYPRGNDSLAVVRQPGKLRSCLADSLYREREDADHA